MLPLPFASCLSSEVRPLRIMGRAISMLTLIFTLIIERESSRTCVLFQREPLAMISENAWCRLQAS